MGSLHSINLLLLKGFFLSTQRWKRRKGGGGPSGVVPSFLRGVSFEMCVCVCVRVCF